MIAIRAGSDADIPALLDLWQAAWERTLPQIDFAARRAWFAGHLSELMCGGAELLVATDAEGPAGFATMNPRTGDLDQLAVAVDRQRQGIAGALLAAAKARAPAGLTLSVNVDNPGAIALYRRSGFAVTGEGISPRSGLPLLFMAWRPD